MPIADLLGVQLDMQLLLKMSVSVAAVLLASWAYRFYSSRDAEKGPPGAPRRKSGTCLNCKTPLPDRSSSPLLREGEERPAEPIADDAGADRGRAGEASASPAEQQGDTLSTSHGEQGVMARAELMPQQQQAVATAATAITAAAATISAATPTNVSAGAFSKQAAERGLDSTTGRNSPCFLQKLESSMGVGRELRQDLERQGASCSFQSKASVKVEDTDLLLDASGEAIVRGKIYDYYVESSSHSITDERSGDSQPTDSPTSLSPIIIRDLVLPKSGAEDPSSEGGRGGGRPARPSLLRKQSYLCATEEAELSFPFGDSSPGGESLSTIAESDCVEGLIPREVADPDPLAWFSDLHSSDVETLKSRLDLGNCLEALSLAKKRSHGPLRQAALGVMADNYLQVLREPSLYGRLMAGEREFIRKQRSRGRRFVVVADMEPQDWARSGGGQMAAPRRTSGALYYYDDYKDTWQALGPIPQEVLTKACAMCTLDNYLFVAIGCQGCDREMTPSKRVFCYNPLTSIWKEISPMNEARPRCKLAALEGFVYAIGGECLSSVERYDPRTDRWTFVAPLPNDTFAVAHHVAVCDGDLFVSGGTLRYMLLRYSPKVDAWRPSPLLGGKDRTADMAGVGRFLYRFDVNPMLGVSVYRYHAAARLWYECSSKRLQHCPAFQCVASDDSIYCISRQFTMRFQADEVSPAFMEEDLSVLSAAKGILFPFVLALPDKKPRQTSV